METNRSGIATAEELPIDPEIEALLEFEAVPRKVRRPDGWTAERQREFIHRLALTGAPGTAARQMGKNVSGIEAIYREEGADSFRAAWDAALELAWARERRGRGAGFDGRAPGIKVRGAPAPQDDEWDDQEDAEEEARRAEDVRHSIR